MGMDTREAAKALEVTESMLHHHLSAARREIAQTYEGLCSLVSEQGVCYQCKGLRDADIDTGKSQIMHDVFWQRTKEIEDTGAGSIEPEICCGQDN